MNLPDGQLRVRRVVARLGEVLRDALDSELTGYLRFESEELLRDDPGVTVLTFDAGVPVAATTTGGPVGAEALARAGAEGLYRVELRELDAGELPTFHRHEEARVPPALPAEQLVGDADLVAHTRAMAPDSRVAEPGEGAVGLDAVESFLDDESTIASIRDRARTEARERADEWGFETVDRPDD
jgi:hypothetical protein